MRRMMSLVVLMSLIACSIGSAQNVSPAPKSKEGKTTEVKALMVIAHTDFRDEEFQEPYTALTKAGCKVTIASSKVGKATGMLKQANASASILVKDAKADDYQLVIFVGGSGASEYFQDQAALELAKAAVQKDKYLAAICIAPSILANAGILKGKKATCFESEKNNLVAKGAKFMNQNVVCDGKLITANGPEAAKAFANELLKSLKLGKQTGKPEKSTEKKKQTVCPVNGGPISSAIQIFTDYKGLRIYFCNPGCLELFDKAPDKYIAAMRKQGVEPEKAK